MREETSQQTVSRREFLVGSMAAIAGEVFAFRETVNHTNQVYEQQNAALIAQLRHQPPAAPARFGLLSDPLLPVPQVLERFQTVTEQVGCQDYLGLFTVLSDFDASAKQHQLLANWNKILSDFPQVTLQIALGSAETHAGKHLLSPENLPWLETQFQQVAATLQKFGRPVEIRFLYEMNTLGFVYSRKKYQISDQDQAQGFGRAAISFDRILKQASIRPQVKLLFNPTIYQPFELYGQDPEVLACFDEFSLDVYDYHRFKGFYLGPWLFPPGKTPPAEIIAGPVKQLQTIAKHKPVSIGEFGSFSADLQWMHNLLLRLAVANITKVTHFDVDKSSAKTFFETGNWDTFPEVDFRVTPEMAVIYQGLMGLLKQVQQPELAKK